MPFGDYDGTAAKNVSQDLKVRCTKNLPYTVKLSGGDASSFAPRKLKDGGTNTLEYNLFTDGGRTYCLGRRYRRPAQWPGIGTGMGVASANTHTIFARAVQQRWPTSSRRPAITPTRSRSKSPTEPRRDLLHGQSLRSPRSRRAGGSRLAAASVGRHVLDLAVARGPVAARADGRVDGAQRGRRRGRGAGRDAAVVAGGRTGRPRSDPRPDRFAGGVHAAGQGLATGARRVAARAGCASRTQLPAGGAGSAAGAGPRTSWACRWHCA